MKGKFFKRKMNDLHLHQSSFQIQVLPQKAIFCSLWKFWKFQPSLNHFYKIEISNIRFWFALENIGCVTSNNVYRLFVSLVADSMI